MVPMCVDHLALISIDNMLGCLNLMCAYPLIFSQVHFSYLAAPVSQGPKLSPGRKRHRPPDFHTGEAR